MRVWLLVDWNWLCSPKLSLKNFAGLPDYRTNPLEIVVIPLKAWNEVCAIKYCFRISDTLARVPED